MMSYYDIVTLCYCNAIILYYYIHYCNIIVYASRIPPRPSESGERLLVEGPKTDPKLYWGGNKDCSIINSWNNSSTTNSCSTQQ